MKKQLLLLALLVCSSAFAQSTVYKPFEVDQVAEPQGGFQAIESYLKTSVRKPVGALAQGLTGRVVVSGTVEPNGRVSGVIVLRGLRADCDSEAVRVFTTFNAWKPALKDGKPVSQQATYSILFEPDKPFVYQNGARINHFDRDMWPVEANSWKARYKLVVPIQSNWLPTGDIVRYKSKGRSWKEETRYKLLRRELNHKTVGGKRIVRLSYRTPDMEPYDNAYEVDEDGIMLSSTTYGYNGKPIDISNYAPNGALIERTRDYGSTLIMDGRSLTISNKSTNIIHQTTWYPTGQIRQVKFDESPDPLEHIRFVWDSAGTPLVEKGNGIAVLKRQKRSELDTTQQTTLVETGLVVGSLKQGIWTGRCADGSYFYEERYDKGVCQGGRAISAGSDTVRYAVSQEQPEFRGGMNGLGQFLSQNLRYPADAQRARVQGKVYVSFVVCTDGTLCDYEIMKGVDPSVDQEALRVVKATSGRWKPGAQRGQNVRVKYNMPINFTLQ